MKKREGEFLYVPMFQLSYGLLTLLVLLIGSISISGAGDTPTGRREMVRTLWEKEYERAAQSAPTRSPYPTEAALVFLSAYDFTRDPKFAALAAKLLDYAHSLEKRGMIVTPEGRTTRDYQARQIYNFYLAYRILGDGKYLRWADACAKAMLEILPRAPHECQGETHTQFAAGFIDVEGPQQGPFHYGIDVNQNAEVGLAYGLLYHDPASAFFLAPVAKEIAFEETLASMSIQDKETGAIPLTEGARIKEFDTAYGSYAVFSWVWSQLLWNDSRMDRHIRAAGRWLAPKMNLSKDSVRYYSFRSPSTFMPYWEVYYRLPLLWYCGVDASRFLTDVFARMPKPEETPGDSGGPPWTYAYYDLMGLPRAYYLDGQVQAARPQKSRHDTGSGT
jgi:hypothetical protein